jgi:hypothetical protein
MDYSTNDPKGWCGDPSRGAALGRPTIHGQPAGAITVRRSPLDRGGYDRNGTYFGDGQPLYWYSDDEGNVDAMERAWTMKEAIAKVRALFPGVEVVEGESLVLKCYGAGEDRCPDDADAAEGSDLCDECEMTEMCSEEEGDDE